MKVPKIFIPEKNLEKSLEKLISKKQAFPEEQHVFEYASIDGTVKNWYKDKKLKKPFDRGLEILRKAGYERHILPWEYAQIMISHFECKLQGNFASIAENMLDSFGEWFSIAVRRKGDKLYCFIDPENVRWDEYGKKYTIDKNFNSRCMKILDITGIPSQEWVSLKQFNDDFVKFFYTRKFKDLPVEMQKEYASGVYLPPDHELWPIGRGDGTGLSICGYVSNRASRGVREKI